MTKKIGFSEKDFGSMLAKYKYNLHPGDIVAGTIFNQEAKGFLVDIGADIAGYLPEEETSLILNKKNNYKTINPINETREFFILAKNKKSQQLLLSIKRLEYIRAWKRIKQLEKEDLIINAPIISINRGGILISLEGLMGFIPNSHVVKIKENENMLSINKKIKCQLLLANEKKNQLILSHKRALLYIFADKLKIGEIVDGTIIQIKNYGLFIRIYGILALLHISEIGDKHIDNINQIFQIGQTIKVKIIHIDMKQGRLSLSRRYLI
uniref:Small ribosomal subunit protein bS1c n=1 Tax=Sebdenia flabellata TaxID=42024 RepID=A0A1C9CA39_9FLOR|nr:ribosomal protein S1 [Sebdenia flabellata]AOM65239.1 ribosomal protein S1 [Sebdenia flabellata]